MKKVTWKRALALLVVFAAVLIIDMVTKRLTLEYVKPLAWGSPFYPYGGIGLFQKFLGIDLSIVYLPNRGSAWGLFANFHEYLLGLRCVAIVALVVYLLRFNPIRAKDIPLTLIIAGALGNVLDCFFYGHVIDMIHFNVWSLSCPVFNIADAAIFLGVMTMLFQSFFKKGQEPDVTYQ
ncbi:MAG: signal peptidase II [Simkaniaceae bacterium]|nr:signal peptidase II [Simkaniaceae bacterium]